MEIRIHGLADIEIDLMAANEKLLIADTNGALTHLNKAIHTLRLIRETLEGNSTNVL